MPRAPAPAPPISARREPPTGGAGLAACAPPAWRLDWLFRSRAAQSEGALQRRPEPIAAGVPLPLRQFETVGAGGRHGRSPQVSGGDRGRAVLPTAPRFCPGAALPAAAPPRSFLRVPVGTLCPLVELVALKALCKKRQGESPVHNLSYSPLPDHPCASLVSVGHSAGCRCCPRLP